MYEFIITFRESLEAVLIVSVFYTLFIKLQDKIALKTLWKAIVASIIASIGIAFILIKLKTVFENSMYEKLTEALLMYLAAGFLLYMILWMKKHFMVSKSKAETMLTSFNYTALFFLIFFAITREGFETALFLIAANSALTFSYLGFVGGIALATAIGYIIIIQGKKIPLQQFFKYSSILLMFFAAGMVAYGTHEMEEYLVKSKCIEKENIVRVWDILKPSTETPSSNLLYTYDHDSKLYSHILHDKGKIGVFLKGLFGYNSNPNYIEFFAWITTLILAFYLWLSKKKN